MESKEALKDLLDILMNFERLYAIDDTHEVKKQKSEIIEKDLDRLEKLEKEHEKLKERYKHRAETSNDLCKAVKQYEKAIEILKDKFKFELGVSVVKEKYYYSLEFLYSNEYFTITQDQYELLKEVLENE